MPRGGRRTPNNPAAVSGPGRLSQRTDGGPGQPTRSFPAEFHGQRQQLADQQGAAPMATAPAQPVLPGLAANLFSPTARPNEPFGSTPTRRQVPGSRHPSSDPDALMRIIYRINPDPAILRLMRQSMSGLGV